MTRRLLAALGLVAAIGASRSAQAQTPPNCADLPNPVVLKIGDTQQPLIKELGNKLRQSATREITLIYETSGSCTNVPAIYSGTYTITANPFFIPKTAAENGGVAWDTSKASPKCNLNGAPLAIDVANSAMFTSACPAPTAGAGVKVKEFRGPNQAYVFVVPQNSSQTAITAAEAYFVFGWGASGMILPWVNESLMYIRPSDKSTIVALGKQIMLDATKWKGSPQDKSDTVASLVAAATDVEAAIGILGSEVYDRVANRAALNALAFKSWGQYFAYYPDSTASATDKKNVRDGHYLPWSPTVWLTRVDPSTDVTLKADAQYLIDLITGRTPALTPDFEPLQSVIAVGLVPDCAMYVTRDYEAGDLRANDSTPTRCDCYFEDQVGDPSPGCVVCDDSNPCASGVCRRGYCEAK